MNSFQNPPIGLAVSGQSKQLSQAFILISLARFNSISPLAYVLKAKYSLKAACIPRLHLFSIHLFGNANTF